MKSSPTTQEARTMPATLFSVTLDVRHNGDSHGTITEVVEADTAAAAETQLVAQAREMLPSNRSVHPLLTVQLTVDREHRFAEGDQVAHVDTPTSPATVEALTWVVSDANVAYPTYTLIDDGDINGPSIEGVVDTADLVEFPVRPAWASAPKGYVRDPGTGELYPVDALPALGSPPRTRIDREGR